MPGKRNLARERAAHALRAPELLAQFHSMLTAQLPDHDRALVGWPAILRELDRFGVRRRDARPLTIRILRRWRRDEGLPLLAGRRSDRKASSPVSTHFALSAWLLSRFTHGALFYVVPLQQNVAPGSFAPTPVLTKQAA